MEKFKNDAFNKKVRALTNEIGDFVKNLEVLQKQSPLYSQAFDLYKASLLLVGCLNKRKIYLDDKDYFELLDYKYLALSRAFYSKDFALEGNYQELFYDVNPRLNNYYQFYSAEKEELDKYGYSKLRLTKEEENILSGKRPKNKWLAFFLCMFLGIYGAHKFYEGKVLWGILYLFTVGLLFVGVIVDALNILLFKSNPYYV